MSRMHIVFSLECSRLRQKIRPSFLKGYLSRARILRYYYFYMWYSKSFFFTTSTSNDNFLNSTWRIDTNTFEMSIAQWMKIYSTNWVTFFGSINTELQFKNHRSNITLCKYIHVFACPLNLINAIANANLCPALFKPKSIMWKKRWENYPLLAAFVIIKISRNLLC